jgi:hypothetical protein
MMKITIYGWRTSQRPHAERTLVHSPTPPPWPQARPGQQVRGWVVRQPNCRTAAPAERADGIVSSSAAGQPAVPTWSSWRTISSLKAAGRPGRLGAVGRVAVTVRGRQPQNLSLTFRLRGH